MATLAPSLRSVDVERLSARWGAALALAATLLVRVAGIALFRQPLESDGLSYWTIADAVARGGVPVDNYGNHAFFSPGYALLLAPAFRLFGSGVGFALAVNLLLAGVSAVLVMRLARALGGSALAATLAGLLYAGWLPGVWSAAGLARENLSVPLLLGFVLSALAIGRAPVRASAVAGLCWGTGVLAGTSVLFTAVGFVAALYQRVRAGGSVGRRATAAGSAAAFVLAAALVLTPWLATTARVFGTPVLTTSGGFNLYVGNNPLATGRFVTMRDLPLGAGWRQHRATDGELAAGTFAGHLAEDYALAHPMRTAVMGLKKLALFWAPNLPDADDFHQARAVAAFRLIEVTEYLLIVALAAVALFRCVPRGAQRVLLATIAGFWAIHALTYIIPRYRDPAMPLLIACAALPVAARLRSPRHAR